jgi:hypothetical protein
MLRGVSETFEDLGKFYSSRIDIISYIHHKVQWQQISPHCTFKGNSKSINSTSGIRKMSYFPKLAPQSTVGAQIPVN